jgi:hypothetical protein
MFPKLALRSALNPPYRTARNKPQSLPCRALLASPEVGAGASGEQETVLTLEQETVLTLADKLRIATCSSRGRAGLVPTPLSAVSTHETDWVG